MKRKIFFLIAGCIFSITALAVIQGYFIYNTYLLKAKEANSAITQQFLTLETTGKLDTLNACWMQHTKKFINDYYHHRVSKTDYKRRIKQVSDSLSSVMNQYINKNQIFEEYEVNYSNYLQSIIIYTNEGNIADTIFRGKMLLYGNNKSNAPETPASQSTWRDNKDSRDGENAIQYGFEVVSQRFYSIANWERQIYVKMTGLLIFSVLLLSFVIILFYLSIKNLITQKKIAEIKTDFINNITHEFQTPLAAMDIAVKTLRKKEAEISPEHFNHSLDIIDRQNIRMQKLFGQVTDASLSDGNIGPVNIQLLDNEILKIIIDDFILSHPSITITLSESKAIFKIDRFHLTTILINLLDNAVKYGATAITVDLQNTEMESVLIVKDNGIGIAKKEQKVIFEKFYRIQKGNIHTTKGLGLGLYYVQQLVKAYHGTISVSSSEDNGAKFTIAIPQP